MANSAKNWFQTPLGRALSEAESSLLANLLPHLFGYFLLQLGGPPKRDWLNGCRIPVQIHLNEYYPCLWEGRCIIGSYTDLPFFPDSIDVALLPHVLEYADTPEEILAEVYQALIPQGHIVILGFHPWSTWGLARYWPGQREKLALPHKLHSSYRVRSWLAKMGYQVMDHETLFFRPPLNSSKWLRRLKFIEGVGQLLWPYLGGVYLIVAKKRVNAMTPIGPRQLLKKKVAVPNGIAQPTARRG